MAGWLDHRIDDGKRRALPSAHDVSIGDSGYVKWDIAGFGTDRSLPLPPTPIP